MGVDAILLDVMGTLVHEPFFVEVPAALGMSLEQVLQEKHPTSWLEFERGEIDEATFAARFFADGRTYDHEGMREAMVAAYALIDGVEPILNELAEAEIPMHLLSNYPVWYRLIEEKLRLSRWAKWSFVSCEMGVRKPDEAIFLRARDALGLPAEAILFVDDRRSNCEAAAELGFRTILFESAPQLRDALRAHGLP